MGLIEPILCKPTYKNHCSTIRKFDLRHYMMISCVNGIVKGYWYKEGYVRTTSTEYSLELILVKYISPMMQYRKIYLITVSFKRK